MRNAGCSSPAGRGYSDAFGDWLLHNRLDLKPSQRAKLLVVMGILPEVEQWRLTLTPTQRLRMNHPGVGQNYRKASSIKPPLGARQPAGAGMRMRPSRRSMQAMHNYRPRIRNRCSWPLAIAEISISSMASLSSRAAY